MVPDKAKWSKFMFDMRGIDKRNTGEGPCVRPRPLLGYNEVKAIEAGHASIISNQPAWPTLADAWRIVATLLR